MSTLMLHTEGAPVTVKVKEFVDREDGGSDFRVIEVHTKDLTVDFYFRSLGSVKEFCTNLEASIHALENKTAPGVDSEDGVPGGKEPTQEMVPQKVGT